MSNALRIDTPSWGAAGTQLNGLVNVTAYPFGAVGDGVTDDTAAIVAALAQADLLDTGLYFPRGTYLCSQEILFDWSKAALVGDPGAGSRIKFTGAGRCVAFDGGAMAGAIVACVVRDIEIQGNAASTTGLHLRAFFHGQVTNVRVVDIADDALLGEFISGNLIANFTVSVNEEVFAVRPDFGIRLTHRLPLPASENSTTNTILVPVIEGLNGAGQTGIKLDHCDDTTIIGGQSQGNDVGLEITENGGQHLVVSLWLEANTTSDIECQSFFCTFVNIKSQTLFHFGNLSYECRAIGGSAENLTIDLNVGAAGQGIWLDGIAIGGALGTGVFTDNGSDTKRRIWAWGPGAWAGSRDFAFAPAFVGAGFLSQVEVGLPYVALGERIPVAPLTAALPDGVEVYAVVIAAGQVRVTVVNHNAGAINLAGFTWRLGWQ